MNWAIETAGPVRSAVGGLELLQRMVDHFADILGVVIFEGANANEK